MSKKPKRRKKNHGAMGIGLLVVLFLMIMLVQIGRLNQKAANLEEKKADLEQQYQQETERAQNLEDLSIPWNILRKWQRASLDWFMTMRSFLKNKRNRIG